MGFERPELFQILNDEKNIDATTERRYLQLWLNQLSLIDSFKRTGGFEKEVQKSFEVDFHEMVMMNNMRPHWQEFGMYYPASFRKSVDEVLHEAGQQETDGKDFTR